jgi:hypothetical protein
MPKGIHTASATVLFERAPTTEALEDAIRGFDVRKRLEAGSPTWISGAPGFVIELFPKINGLVAVQLFDRAWPDGMGDPKTDVDLFGAWTMGFFGPFTFPGNLSRAMQHCFEQPSGRELARRHTAFVRMTSSYVFGAGPEVRVRPDGYDARAELDALVRLSRALLTVPRALCYFNPNGEVLADAERLDAVAAHAKQRGVPQLEAWSNIRMVKIGELDGWMLMDTVGLPQLDADDLEACFRGDGYEPGEVAAFLRNASSYVLERRAEIRNGDTFDGPGGVRWQVWRQSKSLMPMPRPVMRWLPQDGSSPPKELLGDALQ